MIFGKVTEGCRKNFEKLSEANLTANLSKSEYRCANVNYLGHIIGQCQVAPVDAKVQTIMVFAVPTCKKALGCFLGMVGYYCKFCNDFASPLTNLLRKREFCLERVLSNGI